MKVVMEREDRDGTLAVVQKTWISSLFRWPLGCTVVRTRHHRKPYERKKLEANDASVCASL